MAQEVAGHQAEFPFLVMIDGGFGRLYVVRGAGFHFNETEYVAVPSDKIEFSAMMRRSIIPRDDDVALAAQIKVSFFFTAASGALVRGTGFWRQSVGCQPIQRS